MSANNAALPGQDSLDRQLLAKTAAGWVLVGSRDPDSPHVWFPPRVLSSSDLQPAELVELGEEGILYCAVEVFLAPVGFEGPYWVGYVDMPSGVRVFAPLDVGEVDPVPGMPLRLQVRTVRTVPRETIGPVFIPGDTKC
jgi:uncharacterized OB-fold protein